jgi:hypothetical protein
MEAMDRPNAVEHCTLISRRSLIQPEFSASRHINNTQQLILENNMMGGNRQNNVVVGGFEIVNRAC